VTGELAGRRILISGGSSGLGGAIAVACARAGAAVAAIGRDRGKLDELAAATGVTPVVADVADPAAARAAVESAATALGGLDGVVINAGLMLHSLIGDGLDEDWDAIVRVNILGMLHITSAAIPHLRAATLADLCVIASLASDRVAAPDYSVYAATKAAQLRLTEGLRLELAEDRGIRVSLVKPGFMNTAGIGTGTRDPERQKQVLELKERIGLPPAAVAEEIRHLLALPSEVTVPELTIVPTARP
jgi:NADP-dependent 3-hydroxy acid dehydrogenase YdfG